MNSQEQAPAFGADRFFRGLSRVIGVLQGLAVGGIIALILMSIILRNFFDYGLVWVFEAAGFLMVTMVFLGVPKNLYENEDIAVDFLTSRMSPGFRGAAWVLRTSIILAVSITFVITLYHHYQKFGGLRTPTLEIPHWVFYFSVLLGPALAAVIALWHMITAFGGKIDHDRT